MILIQNRSKEIPTMSLFKMENIAEVIRKVRKDTTACATRKTLFLKNRYWQVQKIN